jgi:ATP synthase assembly factor FMC1
MATSQSKPALRALYRHLLRELPSASTHPTSHTATRTAHAKLSTPSSIQARLRSSFADPTAAASARETQQLALAEQAVQYAQAQRMYCTLIERYNPGMGMSEEERVRLSARRIGMNLPVEFGDGE